MRRRPDGSRQELPEDAHEFRHRLIRVTRLNRVDDAASRVILEEDQTDTIEGRAHSRNLRQHFRTVAVLVDHSPDAANLPLDAVQALLQIQLVATHHATVEVPFVPGVFRRFFLIGIDQLLGAPSAIQLAIVWTVDFGRYGPPSGIRGWAAPVSFCHSKACL